MLLEDLGVLTSQAVEQAGAPLDVAEQERHRPRRQVGPSRIPCVGHASHVLCVAFQARTGPLGVPDRLPYRHLPVPAGGPSVQRPRYGRLQKNGISAWNRSDPGRRRNRGFCSPVLTIGRPSQEDRAGETRNATTRTRRSRSAGGLPGGARRALTPSTFGSSSSGVHRLSWPRTRRLGTVRPVTSDIAHRRRPGSPGSASSLPESGRPLRARGPGRPLHRRPRSPSRPHRPRIVRNVSQRARWWPNGARSATSRKPGPPTFPRRFRPRSACRTWSPSWPPSGRSRGRSRSRRPVAAWSPVRPAPPAVPGRGGPGRSRPLPPRPCRVGPVRSPDVHLSVIRPQQALLTLPVG